MPAKTIFKRIIDKEIPAKILYEDDLCLAFADTNPQAPTHLLVIPKKEVKSISDLENEDLALAGHLLLVCRNLARKFGLGSGYRIVTNVGPDAGQSVDHLHLHLLGDEMAARINGPSRTDDCMHGPSPCQARAGSPIL